MLHAVKPDPDANKLAYRLHYETQTAYIRTRDGGKRNAFCKNFIAANSQYAKARVTAMAEDHTSDVSTSVRKAIAYNVFRCEQLRQAVQSRLETVRAHQKDASDSSISWPRKAETNGWNVTEEVAAVTEQFCAAIKKGAGSS